MKLVYCSKDSSRSEFESCSYRYLRLERNMYRNRIIITNWKQNSYEIVVWIYVWRVSAYLKHENNEMYERQLQQNGIDIASDLCITSLLIDEGQFHSFCAAINVAEAVFATTAVGRMEKRCGSFQSVEGKRKLFQKNQTLVQLNTIVQAELRPSHMSHSPNLKRCVPHSIVHDTATHPRSISSSSQRNTAGSCPRTRSASAPSHDAMCVCKWSRWQMMWVRIGRTRSTRVSAGYSTPLCRVQASTCGSYTDHLWILWWCAEHLIPWNKLLSIILSPQYPAECAAAVSWTARTSGLSKCHRLSQ